MLSEKTLNEEKYMLGNKKSGTLLTAELTLEKKVLFAGAGDLALRAISELQEVDREIKLAGVARTPRQLSGVDFLQGSLLDPKIAQAVAEYLPSVLVITLVPNGQGEEGYLRGYVEPLKILLPLLQEKSPDTQVIFASSTSVYHHTSGEWVDEHTSTTPQNFSGQTLLQAERLLLDSQLKTCSVRFGGIYGPGRDFMIRQVRSGKGGGGEFTNRIHQVDASRCLTFLIRQAFEHSIPECLIACDSCPAPSNEVRRFIAEQVGMESGQLEPSESGRGGNKRCQNTRLLEMGFTFEYPSFREGYSSINSSAK